MLDREYEYYQENKQELLQRYLDKFVVIKDNSVIGSYDSKEEALSNTIKEHKLGTFLIQKVSANDEEATTRFYSRVCV